MLLNRERGDAVMDEAGIQALVASSPRNVYYLTDWQTDGGWSFPEVAAAVVPRDHAVPAAVLTIDVDLDWPGAKDATWVAEVRGYGGMEALLARHTVALESGELITDPPPSDGRAFDPIVAAARYLREIGLAEGRVGFEDPHFGAKVRGAAGTALEVVPAADLLRAIRMVKTPAEMKLLRTASSKNELAQLVAVEAVAAGASFAEAKRVYFSAMLEMGGEGHYLAGAVSRPGVGPVDEVPQVAGDTVFFDSFGGYQHYCGDVGRTAVVGPPSDLQRKTFRALRDGWHVTCEQIRPGMDSRELAALVMRNVRMAGATDYAICSPHSVGLEHFDNPHPRSIYEPFIVEAGMVLSVDIPFMAVDVGMLHTEDLALVGDDHVEFLTSNDDRLFVIADGGVHRLD